MANGSAVALPLELDPEPAKEQQSLEVTIGEAVADAVAAILAGVADWGADGRLSPATRTRMGDLFVELYRAQEAAGGELAFHTIALREGKRALVQRYGAVLTEQCGVPAATLDFDEVLNWPLDILRKITAVERAMAH
jgi:hypothetical protein